MLLAMYQFLQDAPRFLFFTGKGGVGKTSLACAMAVRLADSGKRVLLVSTDPASNVGQVFGVSIGNRITPIPTLTNLAAIEIDPEAAAENYRERIIAPVRALLPEREIAAITEQLSGSCTTEVASFNEFTALLTDASIHGQYDHVIFDTAPTGHTIRLLQLPGSWTDFLNEGKGDASCLGPLAGLEKQRTVYAEAVAALQDQNRTRLILVARAQTGAFVELARTGTELDRIGIRASHMIINGVLPALAGDDSLAVALRQREQQAIAHVPEQLRQLTVDQVELKSTNMVGLAALRLLLAEPESMAATATTIDAGQAASWSAQRDLAALVDEIAASGHGLVMCMGKGGVGKTTIAAAIAIGLAHRGHQVHLTTTDPAAHLQDTLHGTISGLRVSRIDPVAATAEYRDRVMATKGKKLDEAGRAALHEDLLSPCTEEVAVFGQFSRVVNQARDQFVVVDTAPTGHTLLLLDAAGSYHRDIVRQLGTTAKFRTPMMMLQDPELTKVVLVTLPEPTPVTEARVLQDDLQRAGINPWAWVVNNSLAAAQPVSPFLRQRAQAEMAQIDAVAGLADRFAVVPLFPQEPIGEQNLTDVLSPFHEK